jgi:hypothetical protein
MIDDPDETVQRIAALSLLAAALDPDGPPDEGIAAIAASIAVEVGGKLYVDADRLAGVFESAVEEARALMPEQSPEVEQAIDEGFAEIGDRVDELTRPKAQH